jgi:hypothetical protein
MVLQREADQIAHRRVIAPSARRVVMTDGGPNVRIKPERKQFLLRSRAHFEGENVVRCARVRKSGALPKTLQLGNVKYMSRFIFAALGSLAMAGAAAAQQVPGRDLLEFPVGLLAEAAPLSTQMTGGLWNPATAALSPQRRAAIGFAGLISPQEQGVTLNFLGGAYRFQRDFTAALSIVSGSVSDILHTDTNPQTLGDEIPYGTTLLSAGLAGMRHGVTLGFATRYRIGHSDTENRGAFALDGGLLVDGIPHVPVRIAASTFLFTPSSRDRETSYFAGLDFPVYRRDSTIVLRIGESIGHTEQRGRESYSFATAKYRQIDLSGGVSRISEFGNASNRWRLGCGVHYASYIVGIGRDDGGAGLGGTYQFLFKRVIP